jgi:hypothetical protein
VRQPVESSLLAYSEYFLPERDATSSVDALAIDVGLGKRDKCFSNKANHEGLNEIEGPLSISIIHDFIL